MPSASRLTAGLLVLRWSAANMAIVRACLSDCLFISVANAAAHVVGGDGSIDVGEIVGRIVRYWKIHASQPRYTSAMPETTSLRRLLDRSLQHGDGSYPPPLHGFCVGFCTLQSMMETRVSHIQSSNKTILFIQSHSDLLPATWLSRLS